MHKPQDFVNKIKGSSDEGRQIVSHFCATCHSEKPLINIGAPAEYDIVDWTSRSKKGIEKVFLNTKEGINAMPARGGCFECSDEQLFMAIIEMLPKSMKKNWIKYLSTLKKDS